MSKLLGFYLIVIFLIFSCDIFDDPGKLKAETTIINFDTVAPGTYQSRSVTLRNEGKKDLEIYSIFVEGESFSLETTTKYLLISSDSSIELSVGFSPITDGVSYDGYLSIVSNDIKTPDFKILIVGDCSSTADGSDGSGGDSGYPEISLTVADSNNGFTTNSQPQWSWVFPSDGVTAYYRLDTYDEGAWINYMGNTSYSPAAALSQGYHFLNVKIEDSESNIIGYQDTGVTIDYESPVIMLTGDNPLYIPVDSVFSDYDPGVSITDNFGGDLYSSLVVDTSALLTDASKIGQTQNVRYSVTDQAGNISTDMYRDVIVVDSAEVSLPPNVSGPAITYDPNVTWSWSHSDTIDEIEGRYYWENGNVPPYTPYSNIETSYTVTGGGLQVGNFVFEIRVKAGGKVYWSEPVKFNTQIPYQLVIDSNNGNDGNSGVDFANAKETFSIIQGKKIPEGLNINLNGLFSQQLQIIDTGGVHGQTVRFVSYNSAIMTGGIKLVNCENFEIRGIRFENAAPAVHAENGRLIKIYHSVFAGNNNAVYFSSITESGMEGSIVSSSASSAIRLLNGSKLFFRKNYFFNNQSELVYFTDCSEFYFRRNISYNDTVGDTKGYLHMEFNITSAINHFILNNSFFKDSDSSQNFGYLINAWGSEPVNAMNVQVLNNIFHRDLGTSDEVSIMTGINYYKNIFGRNYIENNPTAPLPANHPSDIFIGDHAIYGNTVVDYRFINFAGGSNPTGGTIPISIDEQSDFSLLVGNFVPEPLNPAVNSAFIYTIPTGEQNLDSDFLEQPFDKSSTGYFMPDIGALEYQGTVDFANVDDNGFEDDYSPWLVAIEDLSYMYHEGNLQSDGYSPYISYSQPSYFEDSRALTIHPEYFNSLLIYQIVYLEKDVSYTLKADYFYSSAGRPVEIGIKLLGESEGPYSVMYSASDIDWFQPSGALFPKEFTFAPSKSGAAGLFISVPYEPSPPDQTGTVIYLDEIELIEY